MRNRLLRLLHWWNHDPWVDVVLYIGAIYALATHAFSYRALAIFMGIALTFWTLSEFTRKRAVEEEEINRGQ